MARQAHDRIVVSGEKARQGEIILRRRWQRGVFIAGLIGFALLALVAQFAFW